VNASIIAPAAAGLVLVSILAAACGKDAPPPADASETTPEVSVMPATHPGGPERGSPTEPAFIGPVTFERAESSYVARRYDEAVGLFTAYTTDEPENPWGFYMLGLSSWKAGDRVGAEQALRKAIELDSTHVRSRLNLSRVLLEVGRPEEALEQLTLVRQSDPTLGEVHRLIGRTHDARGEVEEAIAAYRRAIVLDTRDVWAMNNLGVLLVQQGRAHEALGPLARATQLRTTSPVFQSNLGTALEAAGFRTAAVVAYGAALAADSTYAKARAGFERTSVQGDSLPDTSIDVDQLAREFVIQIDEWRKQQEQVAPER
jgi:predicted Zn-dependent protease